jgi:hypothetical protein
VPLVLQALGRRLSLCAPLPLRIACSSRAQLTRGAVPRSAASKEEEAKALMSQARARTFSAVACEAAARCVLTRRAPPAQLMSLAAAVEGKPDAAAMVQRMVSRVRQRCDETRRCVLRLRDCAA